MKPQAIETADLGNDVVRVTATFGKQDMVDVSRMVNRLLAYTYEVDSRSDEDIPVLLAERIGAEGLEEARNQMAPAMLAPFVVDALDFQTLLGPQIVQAQALVPGAPYTLSIEVARKPLYELSSYEPVTIALPKARFDDEELAGFMAAIADEHAEYHLVEDGVPVQAGDRVTIDMETYGDYAAVPALCGKEIAVKAGEGWLASEFDENLIGMCAGEKSRFTIHALTEASADENDTEKLTVSIEVKRVMRPDPIDITDEWVAAHIDGAFTVEQFEQLIQDEMIQGGAQPQSEETMLARVAEALADRLEVEISDELYQQTVNDMLVQMDQQALSEGLPFTDYLDGRGLTMETLGDYLMSRARSQIEQGFALDAYYRHFDLHVDDGDIDRAAALMAGSNRLEAIDALRRQFELAGKGYVLREQASRLKANRAALEAARIMYD